MSMNDKRPANRDAKDNNDDGLSPTKRKKTTDVDVVELAQPRLYIADTLAGVSIIWSEREPGCDAYMQALYDNIRMRGAFSRQLMLFMVTNRRNDDHEDIGVTNINNNFYRRVAVRINQGDEDTIKRRIVLSQIAAVRTNTLVNHCYYYISHELCSCSS